MLKMVFLPEKNDKYFQAVVGFFESCGQVAQLVLLAGHQLVL